MNIEVFVNRLEGMGFTDSGYRHPNSPWIRSYDPPANLRELLVALNFGQSHTKKGTIEYSVTVQGLDYEEMGGAFPSMEPNEELLAALQAGSEDFLRWFNERTVFAFSKASGSASKHGLITADGTVRFAPDSVD